MSLSHFLAPPSFPLILLAPQRCAWCRRPFAAEVSPVGSYLHVGCVASACIDVHNLNILNKPGGKRESSRQQKTLDIIGEETAAILQAHPQMTGLQILQLCALPPAAGHQVWIRPHQTMPASASLWGALGYEEGSEKLKGAMLSYRQRQEEAEREAQEAEERRLQKIREMDAKREQARDARVAKLEAWLQECAAKDPGFAFPDCAALTRFLAHNEDERSYPYDLRLKHELESGVNIVVLDFFNTNTQTSKVSLAKMKRRVKLLAEIVSLVDGDAQVLSSSATAKRRLFWQDWDAEGQSSAAGIVEALNLGDDRVARLDTWLKTEAQLSFFKDAASVRAWMDDFGPDSAKRWSVSDWSGNEIVGDYFMNLGKKRCRGPMGFEWNNVITGVHRGSQDSGNMTLDTVKKHLQKLQQVLELGQDMPAVAKLRLCSDFKRHADKAAADIVSDVDLKDHRLKKLDKWLDTKNFVIKSGKQLLQWIKNGRSSGYESSAYQSYPLVQDFFHMPEILGYRGQTIKLTKTLAELKADCRWLHALFRALKKKELDALNPVAARRLIEDFRKRPSTRLEPATAIVELDLRCNRKTRLDHFMASRNLPPPFSNCEELLEWHEDAFVGKVHYGSPYKAIANSSYAGSSVLVGRYFEEKPVDLAISFVKVTANIELLAKLVGIAPELKASTPEARDAKLRLFKHFESYRESPVETTIVDLDLRYYAASAFSGLPLCTCVCIHVCMYAYKCICVYICMCVCRHLCMYVCVCTPCITCTHTLRICVHRCNRKQRLDSWLAEKELRPPFSNCAELLEWHEDAFVGRVHYGSPYKAASSSSAVLGRYFNDKNLNLDIPYLKLCQNIELLAKLVGIAPELKASTPEGRKARLRLFKYFEEYRQYDPSKIVSELDLTGSVLLSTLYSHTCMHTYIHTCIHTCIHT